VGGFGGAAGDATLQVFCGDECSVNTAGLPQEGEIDCLSVNPGCPAGAATPTATPISCGQTIVGTTRASGGMRDIDAYSFTLTSATQITFTVTPEFPALAQVQSLPSGPNSCAGLAVVIPTVMGTGCGVPFSASGMLNAGSYLAVVAPQFFESIDCNQSVEYLATLTCGVTPVTITAANPPTAAANPYQPGQPFTDALDTGSGTTLTAGIGASGTGAQGSIQYAPIRVTFSGAVTPAPAPSNISLTCVGGTLPCPTITSVTAGPGANEFQINLSGAIPPLSCATLAFAGNATGQKVQYRSNPGNVNLDTFGATTQDLLFLVQRINDGIANLPENLARFNVNRSALLPPHVNTQDLLRVVQLLNGAQTTQVFNGTVAATCPP
jgi:hypothetical protein